MVSTHASALMAGSNVVTLRADLREPEQVLGDPQVRDLLDFTQPVGGHVRLCPALPVGQGRSVGGCAAVRGRGAVGQLSGLEPHDQRNPPIELAIPERPADDIGAAWHLCGIGLKP